MQPKRTIEGNIALRETPAGAKASSSGKGPMAPVQLAISKAIGSGASCHRVGWGLHAQVNQRLVCDVASAFLSEFNEASGGEATFRSAKLARHMKRLKDTKKESKVSLLEKEGLQAKCPISTMDAGLQAPHPILRVKDLLKTLDDANQLRLLTGGMGFAAWETFWNRFRAEAPDHPVYDVHAGHLDQVLPVFVYGDEGQSHKKAGFLVVQWQPVCGYGTSFSVKREDTDLGTNMLGVSFTTRFLFSVMRQKLYSRKPHAFHKIMEEMSEELRDLFFSGFSWSSGCTKARTIYLCVIGCKADWPMLKKMGNLVRSHHGSRAGPGKGKGLCHLCLAGQPGHEDWHNIYDGSWKETDTDDMAAPWSRPSPLTRLTPLPESMVFKTWFYRPDVFHTFHKGVMAELAGSTIVA